MSSLTRPFPPSVLLILAAVVSLLTAVSPSRADEAETERRLKRIGVEKALRDEVRVAIDRGVAFLAAEQRADGLWVGPRGVVQMRLPHGDGLNALCALALVHADTADARASSRRATAELLPVGGSMRTQLVQLTYGAGVASLLLDATTADARRMSYIAVRIANGRDTSSGMWNYRVGSTPAPGIQVPPRAPQSAGSLNLSTSQFAVLGLHAAQRRGARIGRAVWTDVLNGLLAGQQVDGSWSYTPNHPEMPNTYPTATFMGVANLVLAAEHLRIEEDVSRGTSRRRRVRRAVANATAALDADGLLALWLARRQEGLIDGYQLWSLEKACVFLDKERIDGTPWYAHAARSLVDAQSADGSWRSARAPDRSDELTTTAFALLVLVRDMESQRVITPGSGPRPQPVITPSGEGAAAAATKRARDATGPVPIDIAAAALARLRGQLTKNAAPNTDLLALLELLARARDDVSPPADPAAPDVDPIELLRGIDAAFVDALFVAGPDPGGDEEGRRPVNRAAATLLERASDTLFTAIGARLQRRFRAGKASDDALDHTPYRPVFRLLAARGDRTVFTWMLDVALHGDSTGERAERCLGFLEAVPAFPELPGAVRRAAADDISNLFVGAASSSAALTGLDPQSTPLHRIRWSRFRPRVMDALLHLATDPQTGEVPRDAFDHVILDVPLFAKWLRDHKSLGRSPWR